LSPDKKDLASLDSFRAWVSRLSFWSDACEANLREMMVYTADGTIVKERKSGTASSQLMEGTIRAQPDYTKIKSPALNIAVVGLSHKVSDVVKTLPESRRWKAENFVSTFKQFQQQEIERFRKQIPNGRVVEFTNTDHHCFIQREDDVVREMRMFLLEEQ
jgi:hypothetical protein